MKAFLDDNFLLETKAAERLFHEYAADMPIFDYHCHLPVAEIADNKKFANLTAIWLHGDHYKWRAMRANGVDEKYITGSASDRDKFRAWAATVPKTLRNPLYHWTHLELKNPFGIRDTLLSPATADAIYEQCSEMLQRDDFSTRGLLKKMRVKVVCTTDDPLDSLEHHKKLADDASFPVKILPAFGPTRRWPLTIRPPLTSGWTGWQKSATRTSATTTGSLIALLPAIPSFTTWVAASPTMVSKNPTPRITPRPR